MLPTKFRIIWSSGFRGKDFQKSTNQKQELPVAVMFVNGSGRNQHSLQRTTHRCFLPSFGSFGQAVSEEQILKKICIEINAFWIQISIVKQELSFFQQKIFQKSPNLKLCLLTNWDKISNLYRGPSIDASYQVSVHLDKWFQRRRFF